MTLKEFAENTNLDYEGIVARFCGMESLVIKFLKKFPDDPTFDSLTQAVEAKDYDAIEKSAHALKGVTGNLGLQELFAVNQKIVDAVRSGQYDVIPEYFRKDQEIYDNVMQCLKELD